MMHCPTLYDCQPCSKRTGEEPTMRLAGKEPFASHLVRKCFTLMPSSPVIKHARNRSKPSQGAWRSALPSCHTFYSVRLCCKCILNTPFCSAVYTVPS